LPRCSCPGGRRRAIACAGMHFNAEISRCAKASVHPPCPSEKKNPHRNGGPYAAVRPGPASRVSGAADAFLMTIPISCLGRRAAEAAIEEHSFDLYNDPMPSMARSKGYINDTAGGPFVFMLAADIRRATVRRRSSICAALPDWRRGLRTGGSRMWPLECLAAGQIIRARCRCAQHGPAPAIEEIFAGKQNAKSCASPRLDQFDRPGAAASLKTALGCCRRAAELRPDIFLPLAPGAARSHSRGCRRPMPISVPCPPGWKRPRFFGNLLTFCVGALAVAASSHRLVELVILPRPMRVSERCGPTLSTTVLWNTDHPALRRVDDVYRRRRTSDRPSRN